MNIFFDVDDTLIAYDGALRPGVPEVFAQLRADGHVIYVWSGNGIRWRVLDRYDLRQYVENCFEKPLSHYRLRLGEFGVTPTPDYVIDDYVEVTQDFPGFHIRPPTPIETDEEMWRVYAAINEHVAAQAGEMAAG